MTILIALFLTGFIPIMHKLVSDGIEGLRTFPIRHILVTTLSYMIGTLFYVSHFPESYVPETFDICVRENDPESLHSGS